MSSAARSTGSPWTPCLTSSWDQETLTCLPLRPRLRPQHARVEGERRPDCDPQFHHFRAQDLPDRQVTLDSNFMNQAAQGGPLPIPRDPKGPDSRPLDTSAGISPTTADIHESSAWPTGSAGCLPTNANKEGPRVNDSLMTTILQRCRTTSACDEAFCLGQHGYYSP